MLRFARRSVLAVLTTGLLLVAASPAASHFSRFGYTLTPEITSSGADATFFIECTAGETYRLQVKITQGPTSTSSSGIATGSCTGNLETVIVSTTYIGTAGNRFKPGNGTMGFRAWTFSGGSVDSSTGTVTNRVQLQDAE